MVCSYPIRVYKNEDITLTIPMDFETEPNEFYLHVYTDNNTYVDIPFSAITIEEGVGTVVIESGGLDPLNDGVIRYELAYSEGDDDYVENRNTNMVLKTPSNYSGRTCDEMWEDGYQSGYTDGQGSQCDCSTAYLSGITEGIRQQKAKLTTLTATSNMTYERNDGYKKVIVNVPQTGHTDAELEAEYGRGYDDGLAACTGDCEGIYESGYTAGQNSVDCTPYYNDGFADGYASGLTDCSGETPDCSEAYQSGYTEGFNEGYQSGQTDCPQYDCTDAWNSGYTSGYTDGFSSGYTSGFEDGYASGQTDCGGDCNMGSVLMYRTTNNTKIDNIIHEGYSGSSIDLNWSYVNSGATVISHTFYPEQNIGIVVWDSCVVRIPYAAFRGFPTLRELYLPDTLKYIEEEAFDCGHAESGTTSNLQFVSLSPNQEHFYYQTGYESFYFSNVEEVILPVGSRRIPDSFFNRCDQLAKIQIPSGVTYIGSNAFALCHSLSAITIPAAVEEIRIDAFAHCTGLTRIDVLATTPPNLAGNSGHFDDTNNCPIYVPASSLNAYLADSKWSYYSSRIQAAS